MSANPYPDFERWDATYDGVTRTVFRAGTGPAVIVIHEVPGLYPAVVTFARRLIAAGLTTYLPSLIGTPGRPWGRAYSLASIARACVSRDFTTWATNPHEPDHDLAARSQPTPIARAAAPESVRSGMCLTGGFALAMMVDDIVVAPALSQPSLPFGITAAQRADLGVDDATLARIRDRAAAGIDVMAMRFTCDRTVPAERFARLRHELGERFLGIEIDSSPGNAHGIPETAHSVVTRHYVDTPGHPTREALDRLIAFFRERLRAP